MSMGIVAILVLIVAANSAPVLTARVLGTRASWPIDGGCLFADGRPWLGTSKTWRGLVAAICVCAVLAPLLGYSPLVGAGVGGLAMLGDMASSFSKRRLRLTSSARASGIDQIPESALPAAIFKSSFALDWLDVFIVTGAFFILEVVFSMIFFRLGIRKHPY